MNYGYRRRKKGRSTLLVFTDVGDGSQGTPVFSRDPLFDTRSKCNSGLVTYPTIGFLLPPYIYTPFTIFR